MKIVRELFVNSTRLRFLSLFLCFLYLPFVPVADAADAPPVLWIQNATILTVSHGTIEHGSILIKGGKIAEVGLSVKAPKDAQVIDAAGQFVIPGIIDCHSHIAVDGNVNEGSISVSSIANVADVLNPDDIDIYRDLAGGVTTANVLHGSANPIGGQTVVIKLRWGQPASKLPFEGALPGIKFALGENPKHSNFGGRGAVARYPATRLGVGCKQGARQRGGHQHSHYPSQHMRRRLRHSKTLCNDIRVHGATLRICLTTKYLEK